MARTGSVGSSYPIWAQTVRIATGVSTPLALLGAVLVATVALLGIVASSWNHGRDLVVDSAVVLAVLVALAAAILLGLWFLSFGARELDGPFPPSPRGPRSPGRRAPAFASPARTASPNGGTSATGSPAE